MNQNNYLEHIQKLSEVAAFINAKDLLNELSLINKRANQSDAELVFPLVGEFSAGKTTLINALTDSKKLETATKPTTSTIYEIHFGCDSCCAVVADEKGNVTKVEDISSLKNDDLVNATVVEIFDTSKSISSSTILVDTPGLSSTNAKHKQALVNFLPKADGILMVIDVNQQITRSLTDFIDTMKLSNRPIYLVITKSDTKASSELESVKKYISDNCKLPLQQLACVSATKGEVSELLDLLKNIQNDKNTILAKANLNRVKNIVNELTNRIDELLKASNSDKDLDEAIIKQQVELNRLNRSIDRLINQASSELDDCSRTTSRRFEDTVSLKLETLVTGSSSNFDAEAVSLINSTSSLLLNDYKTQVRDTLRKLAQQTKGTDDNVNLRSFADVDLSQYQVSGITYDINLNAAGHEYDSKIASGLKIGAAVAAVVVTAGAASGAVGAAGAAGIAVEGGAALAATDMALDVVDTATDVASIASNRKTANRVETATRLMSAARENYSAIDSYNQQFGQNMGAEKGIVESMVGFVTDKTMGKPQRKRAINTYMYETLMPKFKSEIERISKELTSAIGGILHAEADETINQKSEALSILKREKNEKAEAFKQRMSQLKDYKHTLTIL